MKAWTEAELGDVVELKRGYDLPKRLRSSGSIPVVSSSGLSGWHNEAKVQPPGVVTGRYGTLGEVFRLTEPFWPLNTSLYVKDFKGNDPGFVFYLLKTVDYLRYSDKAAVPGVNRNHLHRAEVVVPPLTEQRAIARILGALDDKIELNREMNRTLEATAQAIFRSWFVDFDPVVAKADGRKPLGMRDDLAALFPDRFVESELGPIPRGWEVLPLGEAGKWLSGGTPSKRNPAYWGGDKPWISAKSIEFLCRRSEDRITEAAVAAGARMAPFHSVLFVVRGMSLASEFRLGLATRTVAFNQDLKAIAPSGRVEPVLTLLYLKCSTATVLDLVDEASHGTRRLDTNLLQSLLLVVPKPPEQAQLALFLWPLIHRIECNEHESGTLAALRDLLLPKLLSGEIRVAEAEERLEAAGA